jgi:thiol-disulfide isomerase/thioredoxin
MKTLFKLALILSLGSLVYFGISKFQNNLEIEQNGKPIPSIELQSIDNQSIALNRKSGKMHYLIFFDSFCDHCQLEAALIQKNLKAFEKAEITFISTENMRNLKIFASDYNLKNQPNITFCQIDSETLAKHFGNMGYPTIFIYNTENELVKKYSGETKLEALTKYID